MDYDDMAHMDGEWVRWEDHAAEVERLKEKIAEQDIEWISAGLGLADSGLKQDLQAAYAALRYIEKVVADIRWENPEEWHTHEPTLEKARKSDDRNE